MSVTRTGRPPGRPPKLAAHKRADGNPGKRALPAEPGIGEGLLTDGEVPEAPDTLGAWGLARWELVWTAGRAHLAPDSDRPMVEMLCHATDEAEELRVALDNGKTERWYVTSNGTVVTHPAVTQLRELRTQMTAWLSILAFSPTDRERLGLGEVRVKDELDELADRRAERARNAAG